MGQLFAENGKVVPVTFVEAGPCFVTQIKTRENDGYQAIQLGFEKIEKQKKIKKTTEDKPYRVLMEIRLDNKELERPKSIKKEVPEKGSAKEEKTDSKEPGILKIGDEINVLVFEEGEKVKISGVSKGKGFAGAVKRWNFVDKAKAHGATDMRRLGSIGSRFPQRTIKGRKMAGRMGGERISVKNLKVVKIDKENNLLIIKGAVPGRSGTLLEIRS